MQNEHAAAEAVFQPNAEASSESQQIPCTSCAAPLSRVAHLCAACEAPQAVRPDLNAFDLLQLEVAIGTPTLDNRVRQQLMSLTRDLHPDRFVLAHQAAHRVVALQRMSAVTKAARDLYTVDDRRAVVLALQGLRPEPTPEALQWGERWFEADEDPAACSVLAGELEARLTQLQEERVRLESAWDQHREAEVLQTIATQTGLIQTLRALRLQMQQRGPHGR